MKILGGIISHGPVLALCAIILWTRSHPIESTACPCKAVPVPAFKLTAVESIGQTSEVSYKSLLIGPAGTTCVLMDTGTTILMDGVISVEAKKAAYMQTWTSDGPVVKRACLIEGQPVSHWIIE